MNEDDAVRAALSQYEDSSRPAGYAASFRAGWDAGRAWERERLPVCEMCGERLRRIAGADPEIAAALEGDADAPYS